MDREPLTPEQLREIGLRNRQNEDVKTLLWEIKRLRDELEAKKQEGFSAYGIISRAYQLSRMIREKNPGGPLGALVDDLDRKLAGHPAKTYQDSILPDLTGRDPKPKPGDEELPDPV